MGGTWTANVLKVGTTEKAFAFEMYYPGPERYSLVENCLVDQIIFTKTTDGIFKQEMRIIGADETISGTSAVGLGSTTAATVETPLTSTSITTLDIDACRWPSGNTRTRLSVRIGCAARRCCIHDTGNGVRQRAKY